MTRDATDVFTEAATDYCRWIEDDAGGSTDCVRRSLARLYAAAWDLPDVEPADVELPDISHEAWSRVFGRLGRRLPFGLYWTLTQPVAADLAGPDEPTCGDLADDLADIWRDLKPGLDAWPDADEDARRAIVWEWRLSFRTHWGRHAADAMAVLGQESADVSSSDRQSEEPA